MRLAVQLARSAALREVARERLRLVRGVRQLPTVVSLAGWFGLAGTIHGIDGSFVGFGIDLPTLLGVLMGGLSLALTTTALGLAVAVEAYLVYRFLTGQVELLSAEMDVMIEETCTILDRDWPHDAGN